MKPLRLLSLAALALSLGVALTACSSKGAEPGEHAPKTPAVAAAPEVKAAAKDKGAAAEGDAKVDAAARLEELKKTFAPLPANFDSADNPYTDAKADLGRMLYFDTRLSKSQQISCNTCHQLDKFGVDHKPTSPGHKGQLGVRNSPTVYNAAGHLAQFWDGREPDVEAQAKGPVLNPVEMAMPNAEAVVAVLKSIPGYVTAFAGVFGGDDPVTYDNMAKAIGAFERRLVTPSRFDKWLSGDAKALSDEEIAGFVTFNEVGCATCHNAALVGGNSYQKLGAAKPWPSQKDLGRFEATKKEEDKLMFKVQSLRNIAETGPYFHNGGTKDLAEAVRMMARHQLARELDDAQLKGLVAFLGALTGTPPADYIKAPKLPESGPTTPAADPN